MSRDPLELVGLVLDERYRVDAFVTEGDLSVTYKGHDLQKDTPIGIRCLNLPTTLDPALAGPFLDGFLERTKLHCRLAPGNANVVQTLANGTTTAKSTGQKVPFEIREWLEASTLAAYTAKRRADKKGGWPIEEVLALLDPVADALAYVHGWGLTHGEVNPNNLLVVGEGARPTLKLVDFGEGRAAGDAGANRPVLRVLMPEYTAPEQVDKQLGAVGTWTDVFSLAVVVLDCLAGGLATENVAAAVIVDAKNRPSPKKLGLRLPAPFAEVLERALSLEPKRRPADAAMFWHELKAAASAPARRPAPANPLVKSTLVGIQPAKPETKPAPAAKPPPPEPSFSVNEAPTRPRDGQALTLEAEKRAPIRAEIPLEDVGEPPASVEEPDVFMPALGRLTIALRLRLLAIRAGEITKSGWSRGREWTRGRAWPWVVARARDPRPQARAAFGGSILGGCLVLALLVKVCVGHRAPPAISPIASAELPLASASPTASAAAAAPPEPSADIELPDEVASAAPPPPAVFTKAAATAALDEAAAGLSECRSLGDRWGRGSVRATFGKDGSVARITIGPPFADTPEGACILDRLGRAHVNPFRGAAGAVNYVFDVPK